MFLIDQKDKELAWTASLAISGKGSIKKILNLVNQFSHSVCATPWTAARQASLSITNSWSLLKLMSIKSVMPSNHLILCHPLLLLPSNFPSIRVFSNKSVLHIRWPKYWISSSNEYSGLISFRTDWFDFFIVQGTLKSLLQHHSSVQFNCLVVSDTLRPHGLQQARLPCSSPTPGAYSNSCPSSRWCHPAISSSVVLFSSCLQSFPASGSFLMSQFFTSGGQNIRVTVSASVLPRIFRDDFL